ncbi:MAG: 30S ribosome-binding factor RbfA [Candidatus Omnitrophica bacterium]|nr:30S ribosome-binding factor RbfA [Candidatus Omnitrophota bacterium]HOX54511.1 30S ribosome-binding factor RbfA [Candidatus Omnitrophota bacterium]
MSRIEKLNQQFKREISSIIQNELNDPRLGFITINRVEITKDLSYAKVYFSVLADAKKTQRAEKGLLSAAGYIRRLLSDRIKTRLTPELIFKLDKSTEYSIHIEEEIERLKNESRKGSQGVKE